MRKNTSARHNKRQSRNPSGDSFYTLHIGAPPHNLTASEYVAHGVHERPKIQIHNPFDSHKGEHAGLHRRSKTWTFILDKLQFVVVTVVVFLAIYVTMNWSALSLIAGHYWNVFRGVKSPLEQIVDHSAELPPEKLLAVQPTISARKSIPELNIEVYPPDMRVVIPRINQNLPVVGVNNDNLIARNWQDLEADIQKALRNGVIHYPGTALPGENGNVVITGHSSYYVWDPGRFKDVFALLHDVKNGDKIVVYFNQRKYTYEVSEIKIVYPKDVDVLGPASSEQLTLITCTPIGTNLKRLIVQAKLISKT